MLCRELYGEGFHWAGCALIVLLNQQRRFEAMDFCYHLHRVNRVDQKDEVCKGIVSVIYYLIKVKVKVFQEKTKCSKVKVGCTFRQTLILR